MALKDMFRTLGNGLSEEVKDFKSVMRSLRHASNSSPLGANYRKYGVSFGAYDFSDFMDKAQEFYDKATGSDNPDYTIVELSGNRIAIDYNCEVRGIYTRKGRPIAFFRHDFRQAGYVSKAAELDDFRHGRHILFD